MHKTVLEYERAKNGLLQFFDCREDYHIKVVDKVQWKITVTDDIAFLCYWSDEKRRQDAVIAKKDGEPIIVRKKDHTLVVAIDCIKIAFVLDSKCEVRE